MVPLKQYLIFGVIFSVLFQELFRLAFWKILKYDFGILFNVMIVVFHVQASLALYAYSPIHFQLGPRTCIAR